MDLNNELSGLDGALLNEQMLYVSHSINRILQLYESQRVRPESVIIIGHSMVSDPSLRYVLMGLSDFYF